MTPSSLPAPFLLAFAASLLAANVCLGAAAAEASASFELPAGFHIYKAADAELCGGSYDITFDGEGRLLVSDGTAVRRLIDRDQDGVYDGFEVIASGLGPRGPQGLLVFGDRLYAVGGDGIQVFDGYQSPGKPLVHRGRLGPKVRTGGDHDAHAIFRGFDDHLYFMAGNGAGVEGTGHITSVRSPVIYAREASIFRIDPVTGDWECVATGGRNPPNLGINYLGDLFSLDSDMEWHVGLPWYRPVRLNHWVVGGDQGWQEVGAYPPYFIDCLPGILDVGRGSPTWGGFYEHDQFPDKYRNSFLVCDYRWKYPTTDIYATTGRLLAFFLRPSQSRWTASVEVLAAPKAGAKNEAGDPLHFALVDLEVAPDGSLLLSEHNQGIWRIFYDPERRAAGHFPPVVPEKAKAPEPVEEGIERLLTLPQPGSEWSRLRQEELKARFGSKLDLRAYALDRAKPLLRRLRALRLLGPEGDRLPPDFVQALARDPAMEVRSQAAWLGGLSSGQSGKEVSFHLLDDPDPFVRRRAAEALTRLDLSGRTAALIEHLNDPDRTVRYTAMVALAHRPAAEWFEKAVSKPGLEVKMRALVATVVRHETVPDPATASLIESMLAEEPVSSDQELDFLRVLALFEKTVFFKPGLKDKVISRLLRNFPESEPRVRWEKVGLLSEYQAEKAFRPLLDLLEEEKDFVTQFHLAQALARFRAGWTPGEERRLTEWFVRNQTGWFADFAEKGVEFPDFWATTLTEFGEHHAQALGSAPVKLDSPLGLAALNLWARQSNGLARLQRLYEQASLPALRARIITALKTRHDPEALPFFRAKYQASDNPAVRGALLEALAADTKNPADTPLLFEGLALPDANALKACATRLAQLKPPLDEARSRFLLQQLLTRKGSFHELDELWSALAGAAPPESPAGSSWEAARKAHENFWVGWYEKTYGRPFNRGELAGPQEKSDEELHRFILGADSRGGEAGQGRLIYERAQCQACHGGIPGREGRIFGPDLAGVMTRLTRPQLADALVYPSREVADRYKAVMVVTAEETYTGFVTEQTPQLVTLSDPVAIRRIPREKIQSLQPQATSLMPEHLLNALSWTEIRNLLAFLEKIGSSSP